MKYTGIALSRMLKFDSISSSKTEADMFWINKFQEGRKGGQVSYWTLSKNKPVGQKTRYYPAFSLEKFNEKILPNLLSPEDKKE